MKIDQISKFIGLISGVIGGLFILSGIIGRFTGEFLAVKNFSWFFWAANTFILFGIFSLMVYFAYKPK